MRRYSPGFTLAEVIVIVVIVGIFSTLSINIAQREWEREQVNATAIELAGWLDQVRRAALRGQGCTASIGAGSTPFSPGQILAESSAAPGSVTEIDDTNSCLQNSPFLTPGIGKRAGIIVENASITFTPRGSVILEQNPTSIKISLTNGTMARCVRVSGLIGAIDISKGSSCGDQERF